MALDQTWFAHMQEPFTRIPNLVLTQKWPSAPMRVFPRTRQTCRKSVAKKPALMCIFRSKSFHFNVAIKGFGVYGGLFWQGRLHCLSIHVPVWPGRTQWEIPQDGQMYVRPSLLLNAPGRYLPGRLKASLSNFNMRMVPLTITMGGLVVKKILPLAKDSFNT